VPDWNDRATVAFAGTVSSSLYPDQPVGMLLRNTRTELSGRFSKVDNRPTSSNELIDPPNGDVGLTAGADTAASAAAAAGAADAGPVDNPSSPPTAIETADAVAPITRTFLMPMYVRTRRAPLID